MTAPVKFVAAKLPVFIAGVVLLFRFATPVSAAPITLQLVVTVIDVCDNAGLNCASTGPAADPYFEAEADKIWAQAGIDIKFVNSGTLNSSALLNGSTGIEAITGPLAGPGTTMYLMNTIPGLYGNAWVDAGGLAISMFDVTTFNGGIGRLDTIAHELGPRERQLSDSVRRSSQHPQRSGSDLPRWAVLRPALRRPDRQCNR